MTKMFLIKWSFLSNLSLTAPPYIVYIKMAAFPNNRNFLKCLYYCFTWSQSELKFKLQLHDNEKYNNLSRFFCEIVLSANLYQLCIFWYKKITLKSSAQKYELKLSLVGLLSTLCLTHPTLLPRKLIKKITLKSSAQKPLSWNYFWLAYFQHYVWCTPPFFQDGCHYYK